MKKIRIGGDQDLTFNNEVKENGNNLQPKKFPLIVVLLIIICIGIIIAGVMMRNNSKQTETGGLFSFLNKNKIETQKNFKIGKNKIVKSIFNSEFESFIGTNSKGATEWAFDDVAQHNTKAILENGKIVTLVFDGQSITDPAELRESKRKLISGTQYEKYIEYDNEGYVAKVIIETIK